MTTSIHRHVRDSGLLIGITERFEPELGIQRSDVLLSVQHHRLTAEPFENLSEEHLSEALASSVAPHNDPADNAVRIPMLRRLVEQHAQVRGSAPFVGDPVVDGRRLTVAVVELGFVDLLLNEKHIGAQLQERIEFIGCELIPSLGNHGTIGHGREFNRAEDFS